jgi:hypothetical protein
VKPTKENQAKAMGLLRAMAEEAGWSLDALVSPQEAAEHHALGLTHREVHEMETYLTNLGLLDSDHSTLGGIGLTQHGLDVAHGEVDAVRHQAQVHTGPSFVTNITGSTIGAVATGDHAIATGTVNLHQGPLTQAQHLEHIKAAKKALADDEERLDASIVEALEKFLKSAREVKVEEKPMGEVQAEMEGILDRVWAEHQGKALPQGLKVTQTLAQSPAMAGVTKKLGG